MPHKIAAYRPPRTFRAFNRGNGSSRDRTNFPPAKTALVPEKGRKGGRGRESAAIIGGVFACPRRARCSSDRSPHTILCVRKLFLMDNSLAFFVTFSQTHEKRIRVRGNHFGNLRAAAISEAAFRSLVPRVIPCDLACTEEQDRRRIRRRSRDISRRGVSSIVIMCR